MRAAAAIAACADRHAESMAGFLHHASPAVMMTIGIVSPASPPASGSRTRASKVATNLAVALSRAVAGCSMCGTVD